MLHRLVRNVTFFSLLVAGFLISPQQRGLADFKENGLEYQRANPIFLAAFREAVAGPSKSTVRVLCDGKETALGMVIADSWVLTKAQDLHGLITCRLRDGQVVDARLVGVHHGHDLAVLHVPVRGLVPVELRHSRALAAGSWVACPGLSDEPITMGIVSVGTRNVPAKYLNTNAGFLGVGVEDGGGQVRISSVVPDSPAAGAGLKVHDVILSLQNSNVASRDDFLNTMLLRQPGDVITLQLRRDKDVLQAQATLTKRPRTSRGDSQNSMGSELSSRTSGYATILQHDAVVRPRDCGGPLVDLDGRVVGINISRAGRTETWAVPAEVFQPLLLDLMSGRSSK